MNALLSPGSAVYQEDQFSFAKTYLDLSSQGIIADLSPITKRTRINAPRSPWISTLTERFEELMALPRGWDGYAGTALKFDCAIFAATLLARLYVPDVPAPHLVPGSDGSIQIEWHVNGYDVELDVLAPYEVNAVRRVLATNEVEELELQTDFTKLTGWIDDLGTSAVDVSRMRA